MHTSFADRRLSLRACAAGWLAAPLMALAQTTAPVFPATPLDAELEARAALPAVLGPARDGIAATYSGTVGCRGSVDRFTLSLQVDNRGLLSAQYTRTPWVQQAPRAADGPSGPVTLAGSYDGRTGVFGLRSQPGAARDARGRAPLVLVGVFQEGAQGLLMRPRFGNADWCEVHVARRGNELPRDWQAIAEQPAPRGPGAGGWAIFRVPEAVLSGRDALRRQCAAPLMPWLEQLRGLADAGDFGRGAVLANLFSDALFVPHFGKPFSRLGDSERADFNVQLRGSCSLQKESRLRDLAQVLPSELPLAFMNTPQVLPDVDKVAANVVLGELRRWRDHARQRLQGLATQAQHPRLLDEWLEAARPMTELLLAGERRPFDELANASRRGMAVAYLIHQIDQSPAATSPSLDALERVASDFSQSRREMPKLSDAELLPARQRLQAFMAERAGAAADAWGGTAASVDDARRMARWQTHYPQLSALLSAGQRAETDGRLQTHRSALVQRLADEGERRFEQLREPARPALQALERLTGAERDLQRSHAELLQEPPMAGFNRARANARAVALAAAEPELADALRQPPHLRQLRQAQRPYLLDSDAQSDAGRRLLQLAASRAAAISPFSGYKAEAYMSALYSGDSEYLDQADANLVAAAKAQMAPLAPMLGLMDLFARRMLGSGSPGGSVSAITEAGLNRLSYTAPMLALYLGRWQREPLYQPCLDPAVEITVTTTVTETTRNRLGWESTSTSQSSQKFRVPARHAELAERVGLKDSRGLSQLLDMFFAPDNALDTSPVLDSVLAMMQNLDCRSPAAQHFEAQLIRHWRQRNGG